MSCRKQAKDPPTGQMVGRLLMSRPSRWTINNDIQWGHGVFSSRWWIGLPKPMGASALNATGCSQRVAIKRPLCLPVHFCHATRGEINLFLLELITYISSPRLVHNLPWCKIIFQKRKPADRLSCVEIKIILRWLWRLWKLETQRSMNTLHKRWKTLYTSS